MKNFAAFLLVLLGQGILAAKNPNSAMYEIDGNQFLHHNAGFLYDGGNPNLKKIPALQQTEQLVRQMDFGNFYTTNEVDGNSSIKTFPHEGTYMSFNWKNFKSSRHTDTLFKTYTGSKLDYQPRSGDPKAATGDYKPGENNIWFGRQDIDGGGEKGEYIAGPIETGYVPKYNQVDHTVWSNADMGFMCVDRQSFGTPIEFSPWGLPLNPKGTTGIGKKNPGLWRYGVNHAADPIVMRKTGPEEYEFVMVIRKGDDSTAIPGGMVNPGATYGGTLLQELGEEAVAVDLVKSHGIVWDDLSIEQQTNHLTEYMNDNFDGLMLYRGYSDDDRNSDNAWVETTAVMYMDKTPGNIGSSKITLKPEDFEGHTKQTYWLKVRKNGEKWEMQWPKKIKNRNLFASHKYLIEDACEYAEKCFHDNGEQRVPISDNVECYKRREAFKNHADKAHRETKKCQEKSLMANCCLWNRQFCDNPHVSGGIDDRVRRELQEALSQHTSGGRSLYDIHSTNWQNKCSALQDRYGEEEEVPEEAAGESATTLTQPNTPLIRTSNTPLLPEKKQTRFQRLKKKIFGGGKKKKKKQKKEQKKKQKKKRKIGFCLFGKCKKSEITPQ